MMNRVPCVLGLNQSFSAMGRMLGPIFSGMLFELFVGAPFFSAAGLLLIASLVAFQLRPPSPGLNHLSPLSVWILYRDKSYCHRPFLV